MNSNALLDQLRNDALRDQAKSARESAKPLVCDDPAQIAAGLRERINPLYADQIGTESYELRICAEVIERLMMDRDGLLKAVEIAAQYDSCMQRGDRAIFRSAIASLKGKS